MDYRKLNQATKKDSYALPRKEELLDCFAASTYYSVVDMKSEYHQVEIYEPHVIIVRITYTLLPTVILNIGKNITEQKFWFYNVLFVLKSLTVTVN